ncbi:hypothetical protein E4Z66_01520 [Aliishimia ponticola]|uniref:Uncharacterized protein n=1 Tax=Aliishimia ponticola TaxID=2499833 RepID=A0A4S4NFG5_9RHOB|nr:hypothetical protein [Aliishimia ponticola]THH38279.1 hypothetical protein E4Z66_01520 [Aliishimia ponticola]
MLDIVDAIYNVEASALFYTRPTPDIGALLTELNTRLAGQDGCHLSVSPLSHADWWLLACEKFHIMVAFSEEKDTRPAIDASAIAPITAIRRFDYVQAAQSHTAHVRVEVGDGNAPLPPEARVIMQEFGEAKICDAALKMQALHWTTRFIAENPGFLAMYFGPSERMFCPDELTAAGDTPDKLLRHPVPGLPEQGPNGNDGYSLNLRNPEHLGAPAISLEGLPVSVPLATAVTLLDSLMAARARGKLALEHGRVLKPSAKLTFYVREEPATPDAPLGRFVLSLWKDRGHDKPRAVPAPVPEVPAQPATSGLPSFVAAEAPATVPAAQAPAMPHPAPQTPSDMVDMAAPTPRRVKAAAAPAEPEPLMAPVEAPLPPQPEDEWNDMAQPAPRPGLMSRLMRAVSFDTKLKIASIATVLAVTFWANPYADFTGGFDTTGAPAPVVMAQLAGDLRLFADTQLLPLFDTP